MLLCQTTFIFCCLCVIAGRRGRRPLQNKPRRYRTLYQRSNDFVIKNTAKTFGKDISTTTLSATVRITRSICNTSTKIPCGGLTTIYTLKHKSNHKRRSIRSSFLYHDGNWLSKRAKPLYRVFRSTRRAIPKSEACICILCNLLVSL